MKNLFFIAIIVLCVSVFGGDKDITPEAETPPVVCDEAVLPDPCSFLGLAHKEPASDGLLFLDDLAYPENMLQVLDEYTALLAKYDLKLSGSLHSEWDGNNLLAYTYTGGHDVEVWQMSIDTTGNSDYETLYGSLFVTYSLWGDDEYNIGIYTGNQYKIVTDGAEVSVDVRRADDEEAAGSGSEWREKCSRCHGDGRCSRCGGDGTVPKLVAGTSEWIDQKCTSCRPSGSGKCSGCSGKGYN